MAIAKKAQSENQIKDVAMGEPQTLSSMGVTFATTLQKRIVVITLPYNSMTASEQTKLEKDFNAQSIEVVFIPYNPNTSQSPRYEFIYV